MADAVEAPGPATAEALGKEKEAALQAAGLEAMEGRMGFQDGAGVGEGEDEDLLASGGRPEVGGDGCSSLDGEDGEGSEEPEDRLARADKLFEEGSKAIEGGDFVEAVDCLSRALEIRVANFGELAPECASSYYKYGCALLYKAQEEADPLGNVPKDCAKNSASGTVVESGESSSSSKSLITDSEPGHSLRNKEKEGEQGVDGSSDKDMEDGVEGSGDDEELGEADEDDSDLDLAWKMLDIARAIVEKSPEDTIEKVNILAALGEVAVEREDIETSLNDYQKALSILGNLVEPNHRRIIELYPALHLELNFRICLVLELGSRIEEAIPYCKKASVLCESRLQQLKEEVVAAAVDSVGSLAPSISEKETDIEVIGGILTELEKKLEDLQQVLLNPKPLFAEMMKMISSEPPAEKKPSASLSSSRVSVFMNGSSDSPTSSTARTGGGGGSGDSSVTHLGVVGRGLKRASLAPITTEPSVKKKAPEESTERVDSGISEAVDSNTQSS
ncbi:unnamed protein product [Spirodela intermedia]|uniref:Uncharacterized protein n=1 Tax=Spirodela intermedia TaxID=51605 RepID=A0A7I8J0W6_SPIIN|nr:unnamed protein product [Spirodela intermedia]CAA6663051.1 unnamed protein product [Spirodela intermedia]